MPKYYIFLVKKNVRKIYEDREVELYILLKNLYKQRRDNFSYSISIYNQLFDIIDTSGLKEYLNSKINILKNKNKYFFKCDKCYEKTLIEINRGSLVIISNVKKPVVFKILKYMYQNMFICDFNNDNYYFLHNN